MSTITIGNALSFKTYRWLKVNDISIELPDLEKTPYSIKSDAQMDISYFDQYEYGVSKDVLNLNREYGNLYRYHEAVDGKEYNEYLKLSLDDENRELLDTHDIIAKKNSKLKLILDYSGVGSSAKFRNSVIRVLAEENSTVDVFVIQLDDENTTAIESVLVNIEADAVVNIQQYELGAKKLYTNFHSNIIGDDAELNMDSIYFGYNDHELNMLYNMNHFGKRTKSDVKVNGALRDSSHKSMKQTLDFRRGAVEASGSEEEYTILLDEDVRAISVPVLLANEDDIEGNHAASSGKIDQDLMFYIMTRGFDEREAETLIINSKFSSAISKLGDEDLESILRTRVEEIARR